MSEENNVATIEAPKTAAKPKAKPAAKKLAPKAAPKANGEAQYGMERSHDLPWNEKKVAVFKALKSLDATSAGNSAPAVKVAKKANLTPRDVRHYCYHAKAGGLVGIAKLDEVPGWCFYLTAKGAKVDPAQALKDQNAK